MTVIEQVMLCSVPGKRVVMLNGQYRGMEAVLEGIDEKNFSASLRIDSVRKRVRSRVNKNGLNTSNATSNTSRTEVFLLLTSTFKDQTFYLLYTTY